MQFWCIAAAVLILRAQETRRVFVTSLRQIVADDDSINIQIIQTFLLVHFI